MKLFSSIFILLLLSFVGCTKHSSLPTTPEATSSDIKSESCTEGSHCADCKGCDKKMGCSDCKKSDCTTKKEECGCKGCKEKKECSCKHEGNCGGNTESGSCKDHSSCGKEKGGCMGKTDPSIKARKKSS